MTLRAQVINFVWLEIIQQLHQHHTVREIPIVQEHLRAIDMRVIVEMVNTLRIERRATADDAMHLVALS